MLGVLCEGVSVYEVIGEEAGRHKHQVHYHNVENQDPRIDLMAF